MVFHATLKSIAGYCFSPRKMYMRLKSHARHSRHTIEIGLFERHTSSFGQNIVKESPAYKSAKRYKNKGMSKLSMKFNCQKRVITLDLINTSRSGAIPERKPIIVISKILSLLFFVERN